MIRNLGEGYYGVEATTRAIPTSVLEQMDDAYAKALAISDDAIIIKNFKYKTKVRAITGDLKVPIDPAVPSVSSV
jgi:hypothetical protein